MPYTARRAGRGYAIVNKATGRTVGRSTTKAKAMASARARNAAHQRRRR